jgi:hypothetical protein
MFLNDKLLRYMIPINNIVRKIILAIQNNFWSYYDKNNKVKRKRFTY